MKKRFSDLSTFPKYFLHNSGSSFEKFLTAGPGSILGSRFFLTLPISIGLTRIISTFLLQRGSLSDRTQRTFREVLRIL